MFNKKKQESFFAKKKIIVISLSAATFITLITGLFLVKKNKENSYENIDIGEVVNENNENDNDNEIVNEGDYFFNKVSGQITENVILFLGTGILLFFWKNNKSNSKHTPQCLFQEYTTACCEDVDLHGVGLCEIQNWFGLVTFVFLITITLLVEFVLNQLLIGSISYLFSKDKSKRYFRTLKMSWKKRKQLFFSLLKTKTFFFFILSYLLHAFVIVMIAKYIPRCLEIIKNHHANHCWCFCNSQKDNSTFLNDMNFKIIDEENLSNNGDLFLINTNLSKGNYKDEKKIFKNLFERSKKRSKNSNSFNNFKNKKINLYKNSISGDNSINSINKNNKNDERRIRKEKKENNEEKESFESVESEDHLLCSLQSLKDDNKKKNKDNIKKNHKKKEEEEFKNDDESNNFLHKKNNNDVDIKNSCKFLANSPLKKTKEDKEEEDSEDFIEVSEKEITESQKNTEKNIEKFNKIKMPKQTKSMDMLNHNGDNSKAGDVSIEKDTEKSIKSFGKIIDLREKQNTVNCSTNINKSIFSLLNNNYHNYSDYPVKNQNNGNNRSQICQNFLNISSHTSNNFRKSQILNTYDVDKLINFDDNNVNENYESHPKKISFFSNLFHKNKYKKLKQNANSKSPKKKSFIKKK